MTTLKKDINANNDSGWKEEECMKRIILSISMTYVLVFISLYGILVTSMEGGMIAFVQGEKAPDFTLMDINNNTFTLSEHRGRVVLINFMAVPVTSCYMEMNTLNSVNEQVGDEIVMISIDVLRDDTEEAIRDAFHEYVDKWIFAKDTEEAAVILKYSVAQIPTTFIIDKNGDVSYSQVGLSNEETLLEEIDKASNVNGSDSSGVLLWVGIITIIAVVLVIVFALHEQKSRSTAPSVNLSNRQQPYPCQTCGQPLRFINEYQKWYCDTCQRYV